MNKVRFAALVLAVSPVLMAARCPGGEETSVTCSVTARDALAVTVDCVDNHGNVAPGGGRFPLPGPNTWPGCKVDTFWPSCKDI